MRWFLQFVNGLPHRLECGLKNIYFINGTMRDNSDPNICNFIDFIKKFFSFFCC